MSDNRRNIYLYYEAVSVRHVHNLVVKLTDKKIKSVKLKDNSFWEKVK